MTKDELKNKLLSIILLENKKDYTEIDTDLIDECVSFLLELEGKERLTETEIKKKIEKIPFKGK